MSVNWRDIQDKAVAFAHEWKDAKDEDRDTQPFWRDLVVIMRSQQVGFLKL